MLRSLEALQEVEATFQDKRFLLRSQLTGEASTALRAAGVAAPPILRQGLIRESGEKVVPNRFYTFVTATLLDTYLFALSKIGQLTSRLNVVGLKFCRSLFALLPTKKRSLQIIRLILPRFMPKTALRSIANPVRQP